MAAIAEEEGVDPEDQVVEAVVVVEVLDHEPSQTATIHRLLPLLIALIAQLILGQGVKNNNKVSKNQKWVSSNLVDVSLLSPFPPPPPISLCQIVSSIKYINK